MFFHVDDDKICQLAVWISGRMVTPDEVFINAGKNRNKSIFTIDQNGRCPKRRGCCAAGTVFIGW